MKRYAHYWWPRKGARFPSRIAVLDCDAERLSGGAASRVQTERLTGWALSCQSYTRGEPLSTQRFAGDTADTLWRRIAQLLGSKEKMWLFCTPASRILALTGFWDRLEAGEIALAGRHWSATGNDGAHASNDTDGICIVEDPPTIILAQLPYRPGRMLILDARNWGFDALPPEVTASVRVEEFQCGIRSCVQALRQSGFGALRASAGSQAVSALRTSDDCLRLHCHTHEGALALERASLYGGRSECYRIGDVAGPVYHVDVRSMYASICLTLPIPVSIRSYHADSASAERCARSSPESTCADVTVRAADPRYPVRRRGYTVYPVGIFRTTLCGRELGGAVQSGSVLRWHAAAEYVCAPLLGYYYTRWLAMLADARASGSAFVASWCKRVMNALPGKFGEPGRQWTAAPSRTHLGPYGTWWEAGDDGTPIRMRNIGWNTQRCEVAGESYWSMPAVAAWIAAAGRVQLDAYRLCAGPGATYYTDTDSLVVSQSGYENLLNAGHVRDGETGYLRLLGSHSRCRIEGFRHYALDGVVSCAGVPRGQIEAGETRIDYWHRAQIAAEIAMGHAPRGERRLGTYPTAEPYHHGVVHADGTVTPLEIWDE